METPDHDCECRPAVLSVHFLHVHHLCRDCWAQQPQERPSFDEVVGCLQGLLDATPTS